MRLLKTIWLGGVFVLLIMNQSMADENALGVTAFKFKYTGKSCTESFANSAVSSCLDYGATSVGTVVVRDGDNPETVIFRGPIETGKKFTVDAMNGESFIFWDDTLHIELFDQAGGLTQAVTISLDPANLPVKGDVFGGLVLEKVENKLSIPKSYSDYARSIVTFSDSATQIDKDVFTNYWSRYGVTQLMALPLVNSAVYSVPDFIPIAEIADDPIVTRVESDAMIALEEPLTAQGRSFIRPLKVNHELIKETFDYPWAVAKLYGMEHDYEFTSSPLSQVETTLVPEIIRNALHNLKDAKLRIAVFDTGINKAHKNFNGDKLKSGIDIVKLGAGGRRQKDRLPPDDNGHGTHVAGILTAALDREQQWGKKLDVKIYGVKVLDNLATGKLSNVIMGLQWAIYNDIDIVSMSIGYANADILVQQAIQNAVDAGLIIVASSGNRSNYDPNVYLVGLAEGAAGDGGSGDGGSGDGGSGDGGSGDGGSGDGGSGDGGSGDGGSGDGGSGDGGSGDGGSGDGGSGDGGSGDGGSGDGGSGDGGSGDGGSGDGGSGDGGSGDGGSGDGGSGDGGSGDGGSGDGGSGDGGSGDGGSGDGGSGDGGSGDGGSGDGGSSSAPNHGQLPLFSVMYPARFPGVTAVGSTNSDGSLAPYTNVGDELDILAPGTDIVSADITNGDPEQGLGAASGTSMSTPLVTAAIALMLALDPHLDRDEITEILRQTADYGATEQAGELNLLAALNEVQTRVEYAKRERQAEKMAMKEAQREYRQMLKEKIELNSNGKGKKPKESNGKGKKPK